MLDPITLEILKHAFVSAAEEEAATLTRTAYSMNVRERADYSTAVCDAQGRLVAQSLRTPIHLGGISPCVRVILEEYGDDINEEDFFLSNDPFSGGQHTPDFQITYPIFHGGHRVGFGCAVAHHEDVGGRVPGSQSTRSEEVYEEGLRLHHVRLYHRGQISGDMLRVISANVRYPETTMGDLRAQIAAAKTGAARVLELIAKYGEGVVIEAMSNLMEVSERRMRDSFRTMPAGVYRWVDHLDNDGHGDEPCTVMATVTLADGDMTVDFTGTSPQGKGAVNSSLTATTSATYYAARALADPDIMQNDGCFRPVHVIAPEGTLINPRFPAACSARATLAHRIDDCIFGALAGVAPERIETATYGNSASYSVFGKGAIGRRWFFMEASHGSGGARLLYDANDGCTSKNSNPRNLPMETLEVRRPIRFVRFGFETDSGGAGRRRGGLSVERCWELIAPGTAGLEVRGDRQRFPPWGLDGGKPGRAARVTIFRGGETREEHRVSWSGELAQGDIYSQLMAGGGGFGDPLEREPEMVLADVLDDKVSVEGARDQYGVVIEDERVNLEATEALRAARRRS